MSKAAKTPPGDDYAVGYGKPPTHTRFRKGQSGNPRGRPRRWASSFEDLLEKELRRLLPAREGERIVQIRAVQAVARNLVATAAKGSIPGMRLLLQLMAMRSSEAPATLEAEEVQRARLQEALARLDEAMERIHKREQRAQAALGPGQDGRDHD